MQKIEVVVRITKDHCPPQEQTIFERSAKRWIFKKYMDDPTRFASDFRVRSPVRSAKVFWA